MVTVSFKIQFPLTEQNILLTFHIDREVPKGRGPEERKIMCIYLLSKLN
jgi:hypothetical protein